jgi:hypothetical protein
MRTVSIIATPRINCGRVRLARAGARGQAPSRRLESTITPSPLRACIDHPGRALESTEQMDADMGHLAYAETTRVEMRSQNDGNYHARVDAK